MKQIKDATYLAIIWSCNVNADHAKYDGQESGQTRNGIDLPKGADKIRALGRATKPNKKRMSLRTHIVQR